MDHNPAAPRSLTRGRFARRIEECQRCRRDCLECVIERQERQEMLLANHDAWLEKEVRPSDVLHE